MFDFVRRHTKIIMVVLFLLVIPSFVLLGIDGYTRMNDSATAVAKVDGQSITQQQWDAAHRQDSDRLRAANPQIDGALLDSPMLKYASLERLVRERVLAVAASKEHLMATDARLAAQLEQDPAIAALRRADGSLDMDRYRQLLGAQGLTPEAYESSVRQQLSAAEVLDAVIGTGFATQAQADVALNAYYARRQAQVQHFKPADYAAKVSPTDADLKSFYEANAARYQAPESAKIEYVVLDLDAIKKSIAVSEQDLRTYYEQNAVSLGAPEERRASHILILAPKDAPAAEREKAKATATALLEQVRKAPGTFAEVARKSSQDDASAASGGDLGSFRRDKGIDPAIAKAAFALAKVGDISDLVESDFGYHIVELTHITPAAVPSFEALRAKLEDQYRTAQAQKQFSDLAEEFRNGVYEQADSLKPVAEKLKLTVQTADNVLRTPAPGATGPLADPRFLNALFAADSIGKKRNTEALELGGSQLVSGRIVAYTAAHARAFSEVAAEVRSAFVQQRAAELARQAGQAQLKAWQANPAQTPAGMPAAIDLSRVEAHDEPQAVVEAVLRADPAKLPSLAGVDLGAAGYAVVRVVKVLPPAEQTKEQAQQNLARYQQAWGTAEARSYYETLKVRYKVKILVSEPSGALPLPGAAAPR